MCGPPQPPPGEPAATDADRGATGAPVPDDAWQWLIGSLCALHQIAFDATLLRQRVRGPCDLQALPPLLVHYGLQATAIPTADIERCNGGACVAALTSGRQEMAPGPVLVRAIAADRVTYFELGADRPTIRARADFLSALGGPVLDAAVARTRGAVVGTGNAMAMANASRSRQPRRPIAAY